MGLIVGIEPDFKSAKDLKEGGEEVARLLKHEFVAFETLAGFKKASLQKPLLLIVPIEELGLDPFTSLTELKNKYGFDIIVTVFDHSPLQFNDIDRWPIVNFIFKSFDTLILQEHLRFALLPNQNIKTAYVHTTEVSTSVEHLQKIEAFCLSETGFKIKKGRDFKVGENYKFYHPLFTDNFAQHVWARLVTTDAKAYEFLFTELSATVLSQIRARLQTGEKKNVIWMGRPTAEKQIQILIQLKNPDSVLELQELLTNTYEGLTFLGPDPLEPEQKKLVDLLITDRVYLPEDFKADFKANVTRVSIVPDIADTFVDSFLDDTIRFEKTLDFSFMVKLVRQLFPALKQVEPNPVHTIDFVEAVTLTENLIVTDFSEATVGFLNQQAFPLRSIFNICLPPNDENVLKDFTGRLHYVDTVPNADGLYYHKLVLFGMKDELLKLMRLWAIQKFVSVRHAQYDESLRLLK